ncbi:MAG: STAS/SEC14 domain-containing protein [Cyanobacteria bacterium J06643_5]
MDPIALWKDAKFGLSHVNDFTHVAVAVEQGWMRTISSALGNILSAEIKAFEPSEIEAAREWLNSCASSLDSEEIRE